MDELEKVKRDLKGLLESNRLAWLEMVERPMTSAERHEIRKQIAHRDIDISDLFHRKWVLEDQGNR
jgi:hypothetical protein